jgi:hypothetical protein
MDIRRIIQIEINPFSQYGYVDNLAFPENCHFGAPVQEVRPSFSALSGIPSGDITVPKMFC